MEDFQRAYVPEEEHAKVAARLRAAGFPEEVIKAEEARARRARYYRNDTYQVLVDDQVEHGFSGLLILHLSIKRNDRQTIRSWRDLQTIKNKIVGEEYEAFEIYPAESRLVDTSNQYHLWVLMRQHGTDEKPRLPIGFQSRSVLTPEQADILGAVQNPLDKP